MKCDNAPETLVSLLYDELDLKEEKKIRKHLEHCPSCRKIFEELQDTTELLGKWEDEAPGSKTVFMQEPATAWQALKEKIWGQSGFRPAWGLPMMVGAALLLLFIFNFRAGYENGDWYVAFGKRVPDNAQVEQKVESILTEWQARNAEQLVSLIRESETRQRREFTLALNEYAHQQELVRRQDLQMVNQGFQGLQRQTEGRYYQTSTLINDLLRMTNSPATQP